MTTEKILRKIGLLLIEGKELTLPNFKDAGIKGNDISRLEIAGLLVRDKDGVYQITNTEVLYKEIKKFMIFGDYVNAEKYLNSLLAIDPNHIGAHFQAFIFNIINYRFDEAIPHLDFLYTQNVAYQNDYNLYWLLLCNLTTLPPKYQAIVDNLTLEDLIIGENSRHGDINPSDLHLENAIRRNVLNRKFVQANNQSRDLRNRHRKSTTIDAILYPLIRQCISEQNNLVSFESAMLKQKKYEELENYLKSITHKKIFGLREECLLKLISVLRDIKSFKRIPRTKSSYVRNLFDAIKAENYHLAFEYSQRVSYVSKSKIPNPVEIILSDITIELDKMKNKHNVLSAYQLESVLEYLRKNDYISFKTKLSLFLSSIDKTNYQSLINSLIELDLSLMNPSHEATVEVLIKLNNREDIDINNYLTGFYNAINRYNFALAHNYLNILIQLESLGYEINSQELGVFLLDAEFKNQKEQEEVTVPVEEYINYTIEDMRANNCIASIIDITPEERQFVATRSLEYKLINFSDTSILVYEQNPSDEVDFFELRRNAIRLFNNKDYKNSAILFEELISYSYLPNIYMARFFKYLGICYYNSGVSSLAKEYLTISDRLFTYLNIPSALEGYLSNLSDSSNDKPSFIMNLDEFSSDYNMSSLEGLSDIAHLFIGTDLDIEEVCNSKNLEYDDQTYIYILIAREYFQEGNMVKGNKYLKIASQRKNKPEKALELIEYLQTNKRFIQNRKNKELVLS